jgi:TLC domain
MCSVPWPMAHKFSLTRLVVVACTHHHPVFLAHHLAAALTAYFSLEYQMCHYYANFFGGCSELSTLFLVFCDFDVYFPSHGSSSSLWKTFILTCQVCFVMTFLAYRVVGWWMVSYELWTDALWVLRDDDNGKKKNDDRDASRDTGKMRFLYVFLAMDVALGLLQVYWFVFGMLPKIVEIVSG